jgi:hypothetical protein
VPNLFGPDFDPTVPPDTQDISEGASWIRDVKTRIKAFFTPLFNLDTGTWNNDAIPPAALQDVVGLAAGTYTISTITVDSKGRVTAAASGAAGSYKATGAVEQPATGGTGQSSVPPDGQILIGSGGVFALKDIVAAAGNGSGIIVTTSAGNIVFKLDMSVFPAVPFFFSTTLSSASAATPVTLVPDFPTGLLAGRRIYLTDFLARVDGATAWAGATSIFIQDTNGTPVSFATIPTSILTANTYAERTSAGVTLNDAITRATGGTASKGLQVVADTNGTGSNLIVSGWGYYK